MRVGIIAMGRSGGYNLGEWIRMEKDAQFYHEPIINRLNPIGENIVVKWLYTEWNEWIGNEIPQMDKWIGVWRENIRECAISHTKSYQTGEWRTGYKITNEWIKENEDRINETEGWIKSWCDDLLRIPQIELTVTYEGIYNSGVDIKRLTDYLDIKEPKYLHLLHPKLRLRETETKPKKDLI